MIAKQKKIHYKHHQNYIVQPQPSKQQAHLYRIKSKSNQSKNRTKLTAQAIEQVAAEQNRTQPKNHAYIHTHACACIHT